MGNLQCSVAVRYSKLNPSVSPHKLKMMGIGSILAEPTTWVILIVTALWILYKRGTKNFNVFSDQGIPGPKPIPFIGTTWGVWKINMMKVGSENVKRYGDLYGSFEGTQPTLHINDTELVKSIFVKDFDHFINRRVLTVCSHIKFDWNKATGCFD